METTMTNLLIALGFWFGGLVIGTTIGCAVGCSFMAWLLQDALNKGEIISRIKK